MHKMFRKTELKNCKRELLHHGPRMIFFCVKSFFAFGQSFGIWWAYVLFSSRLNMQGRRHCNVFIVVRGYVVAETLSSGDGEYFRTACMMRNRSTKRYCLAEDLTKVISREWFRRFHKWLDIVSRIHYERLSPYIAEVGLTYISTQ